MKKFLILLLVSFNLYSTEFGLITMMKTGTHLTKDLLIKLTQKKPIFISRDFFLEGKKSLSFNEKNIANFFTVLSSYKKSRQFAFSHSILAHPYAEYAKANRDFVLITNYRDLRDAVVSLVYYLEERNEYAGKDFNLDQKIMYCISKYVQQVEPLPLITKCKNLFIVKFEDLVGSQGGGSDKAQLELAINLSKTLGLNNSPESLKKILASLFGNSGTFRKGVIGEWRSHFNEEHKAAFKQSILGKMLIEMGYETGYDW